MFSKHISLLLCIFLLFCHMLVPVVEAGGHHGHNNEGLAVLLAAGMLAKILGHKKHEEHHIHIPVPVHHHEHHGHHEQHGHHEHHGRHGSGTTRIIVHHPPPSHHPVPFHHIYGGMREAPSFVQRVVYNPPLRPVYPHPPVY